MKWQTAAKLNRAKHATRTHRKDGSADRFVMLWDSKQYNNANFVGRVDPKTMESVSKLGLWEHDFSPWTEYQDTTIEHWWLVEEVAND